jgi:hypothetical protein
MAIYHVTAHNLGEYVGALNQASKTEAPPYRAIAGRFSAMGWTAGDAIDALLVKLAQAGVDTPRNIAVHKMEPDEFFNAEQQARLQELMKRHKNGGLPSNERTELQALVDAELEGAIRRTEKMFGATQR